MRKRKSEEGGSSRADGSKVEDIKEELLEKGWDIESKVAVNEMNEVAEEEREISDQMEEGEDDDEELEEEVEVEK